MAIAVRRCECDSGYLLVGNACEQTKKSSLGKSCKSDDDCKDPAFPYCANADQAGYCTKPDCKTSAECDTTLDYGCNDRESPSFCERPPEGLGKSCSDDTDCEGGVATFCEALSSHVCVVNECKSDPNKCHGDWVCCDIAVLGSSLCVPPSELVDGACPAGGMLIPRAK